MTRNTPRPDTTPATPAPRDETDATSKTNATSGTRRAPSADGGIDSGPGRLFTLLYGVFAVGATSRSVYQLASNASEAPFAYTLSALSAFVYVVAFVLLLCWGHPGSRRALRVVCLIELAGVLIVGTLSLIAPELFPRTTVWSYYGVGYLLMPAILPILVLRWLKQTEPAASPATA